MNFDEWYESNKEVLTTYATEGKLRKAFDAGREIGVGHLQEVSSDSPEPECAEGRI